jgi:DNA-directed RNA polymerase specialized sigma24 family protein
VSGKTRGGPYDRACEELSKREVQGKLLKWATQLTKSVAEAQDLVQAALTQVFDPKGRPWDPNGPVSFFMHVGSVMNGIARNEVRRHSRKNEIPRDLHAPENEPPDSRPLPDELLAARRDQEQLARLGNALAAALAADDPVAASVYEAMMEGVEGHAEQAARAGCAVGQVRLAYDRMKYQWRRLWEREAAAHGRTAGFRPAMPNQRFTGAREEGTS